MASCSFTALGLFLLVLCNGCLAIRQGRQEEQEPYRQSQGDCRLQKLRTLEPDSQIQHEAGVTQIWNPNSDEMQCAGITASRHVIDRRAALLPSFTNAPMVVYVEQGRGLLGTVFPGCPETYQSFQRQSQEGSKSRRSDDRHQKLRRLQQGDVFVLTAGVAHWVFNDGSNKLVLFAIHDVSNRENQLDDNLRRFLLAGSPPERRGGKQQLPNITNIFQHFDTRILADAFSVPVSIARKLKEVDESKGFIVRVQKAFQVIKPQASSEEEDEEEQRGSGRNGIEETFCSMKLVENIADPERADIYTAEGGRIATLNSRNLPILKRVKLSAGRVVLHKNGMVVPHWNMDAHSIMFVTKGSGKVQVIGMSRRPIFDGEVRKGQILIVPQNHALTKIAGDDGLEWFTVKTNDQASITPLAGPTSAIRALPVDLLMSSYGLTNQEARKLKEETKEVTIVVRRRSSRGRKEEGSREGSRRPEEEEEEEEGEESEGSSRGQKEEGREGSSRRKEDKGSEAAVEAVKAIVEAIM